MPSTSFTRCAVRILCSKLTHKYYSFEKIQEIVQCVCFFGLQYGTVEVTRNIQLHFLPREKQKENGLHLGHAEKNSASFCYFSAVLENDFFETRIT
jgi:hypothetical protein